MLTSLRRWAPPPRPPPTTPRIVVPLSRRVEFRRRRRRIYNGVRRIRSGGECALRASRVHYFGFNTRQHTHTCDPHKSINSPRSTRAPYARSLVVHPTRLSIKAYVSRDHGVGPPECASLTGNRVAALFNATSVCVYKTRTPAGRRGGRQCVQ